MRYDDVPKIPAWSWMRIELGQRSIHRIRKRPNHGLLVAEGQEHSTYHRTHSHFWGEATCPSRETLAGVVDVADVMFRSRFCGWLGLPVEDAFESFGYSGHKLRL